VSRSRSTIVRFLVSAAAALLLTQCKTGDETLTSFLPADPPPNGWELVSEATTFNSESLYSLVNGQAESYFAYGFKQVAVQGYENAERARLSVEIWELDTPADAYGLFTTGIAGDPTAVGNEGDTDPGRRLSFWQDRYYVQVRARQELPDSDIRSFAESIAARLPAGGERPALVDRLPAEGQIERSTRYFHEEISLQDELWLGGENLLNLSSQTNGCLARYQNGDKIGQLLLIEYPDEGSTADALAALLAGSIDSLVTASSQGNLLGAVFGEIDSGVAQKLLASALNS